MVNKLSWYLPRVGRGVGGCRGQEWGAESGWGAAGAGAGGGGGQGWSPASGLGCRLPSPEVGTSPATEK
ncbi:hypothetical protein TIFTF001_029892 [Ficus carica]|uniref:Uncharacterized protein n=1 Tax=Ficus carica TaxID=3494 RepID=A0AA88DT90_FICCA|nr:hypothetical protein TIFTF001_029892 [Ficus carica]